MRRRRFLNSDICFDVLSRLPSKTLLGLKCVSKEWHRLISDRSFIQAQLQKPEPVSVFFYQERYRWCNEDIKTICYIPAELAYAEARHVTFDFLPEAVVILASCNGLICCRSCLPCEDSIIYICNPSNKEWVKLGPINALKREDSVALAFDPLRDPVHYSTNFKLVRAEQFKTDKGDFQFSFNVYSSETKSWTKSKEICRCNGDLYKSKGIFVGGVLHWLTDDGQILTFNVEEELSWLISVPIPPKEFKSFPEACIGESEGRLHYVMVCEEGLQVWVLEDYFEFKWALKHQKPLDEMEKEHPSFFCNLRSKVERRVTFDVEPWIDPYAFKDGLLLMKAGIWVFLYNVEENKMEEVGHSARLGTSTYCPIVVPYVASLVPLKQV